MLLEISMNTYIRNEMQTNSNIANTNAKTPRLQLRIVPPSLQNTDIVDKRTSWFCHYAAITSTFGLESADQNKCNVTAVSQSQADQPVSSAKRIQYTPI